MQRLASPREHRHTIRVANERTTVVVQQYLDQLAGTSGKAPAEPIIRQLLAGSLTRLQLLCRLLLFRSYPRLAQPPLNLQPEEMLSAVVERMLKAMQTVRPVDVRQFFALANRHMRWELNDLARRLDKEVCAYEIRESRTAAPAESSGSQLSSSARRILDSIESLPAEEREAFDLIRIQGVSFPDAAGVTGVSIRTVRRRLNRALLILSKELSDLKPAKPTLQRQTTGRLDDPALEG
jgi:RNA polymerase sigma factor (sigma-70 family)